MNILLLFPSKINLEFAPPISTIMAAVSPIIITSIKYNPPADKRKDQFKILRQAISGKDGSFDAVIILVDDTFPINMAKQVCMIPYCFEVPCILYLQQLKNIGTGIFHEFADDLSTLVINNETNLVRALNELRTPSTNIR